MHIWRQKAKRKKTLCLIRRCDKSFEKCKADKFQYFSECQRVHSRANTDIHRAKAERGISTTLHFTLAPVFLRVTNEF